MIKVKIRNAELEAALLNPETAKRYDDGVAAIAEKADEAKLCGSCCEAIKIQCNAVINFIDDIFGEGSAEEAVGVARSSEQRRRDRGGAAPDVGRTIF